MQKIVQVILSCLLFVCVSYNAAAKELIGIQASELIHGAHRVILNDTRNTIQFVEFDLLNTPEESNIQQWIDNDFKSFLKGTTLSFVSKEEDGIGGTHYKYHQILKGKQIEYSVVKIHCSHGKVSTINTELYVPVKKVYSAVNITTHDAVQFIKNEMLKRKCSAASINTHVISMVYFPMKDGNLKLCYKIDASGIESVIHSFHFYISASQRKIIFEDEASHPINSNGITSTVYSGIVNIVTDSTAPNNFILQETGLRNIQTKTYDLSTATSLDISNTSNTWNSNPEAGDIHYGVEKAFDYYHIIHNRNSYDNLGATIVSNANFGLNYPNAEWNGIQHQFYYGSGSGIFDGPFTSIATIGHEFTHAVTQYSAALVYNNEPGSLNESFSDIFGTVIDFYVNPTTANFKVGDEIFYSGLPYRDMSNPNATSQPDTYMGNFWSTGMIDIVHTNSQVQNYWFYLLCNGGSGINDHGEYYTVTPISMSDAAKIAYRNLTVYLTPNSTFADSRIYSIQSAIDLFGNCSQQMLQVINAWHAVGVGGFSNSGVYADFAASQTNFCNAPATLVFSDSSINASTFFWNFGDGLTSNLQNPTHTYASPGDYTVTLIVTGSSSCNSSDTLILPNYIHVNNTPPPLPASCISVATSPQAYNGILNLELSNVNRASMTAMEGYKDFTCSDIAYLDSSSQYLIKILLTSPQHASVWIDYNNDGILSNAELVGHSPDTINHNDRAILLQIPTTGVVYNQTLRMRVNADVINLASACTIPLYGQTEDYSVVIHNATLLQPIADFTMTDTVVSVGATVFFHDLSLNGPANWHWSINGGMPNNSMVQNPISVFNVPGVYPIKLVVSNAYGTDSITKYIHVVNEFTICNPVSNSTNLTNGILYDSGGPNGPFGANENCEFTIAPGACTDSIVLTLHYFHNAGIGSNNIEIQDGLSSTSSMLGSNLWYSSIPQIFRSYTDSMYIRFFTSLSGFDQGFKASWIAYQTPLPPPVANFNFSPAAPTVSAAIQFNDLSSSNTTLWYWNFGDGGASTLSNPVHVYSTAGTYTVTLIAVSCGASDTITHIISVGSLAPANFNASPLVAYTNLNIQFNDLTIGSPTAWNWSFLGSTNLFSVQQNPILSFPTSGYYDVSLVASNSSLSYGLTQYNYIHIIDLPAISFIANPMDCMGNMVFNSPLPSPYTNLFWNFGDGNTLSTTSTSIQHAYLTQGVYTVKLIAYGPYGNDTIIHSVNVSVWQPTFSTSGTYVAGTPISFTINSINPVVSAFWDFGDGNFSSLFAPTNVYLNPGTYTVNCTVEDSFGCTTVITDSIIITDGTFVNPISQPDFNIYPNPFLDHVIIEAEDLIHADLIDCKLYEMQGNLVYHTSFNHHMESKLDFKLPDNLAQSTYQLVIVVDGKVYTKILQRK